MARWRQLDSTWTLNKYNVIKVVLRDDYCCSCTWVGTSRAELSTYTDARVLFTKMFTVLKSSMHLLMILPRGLVFRLIAITMHKCFTDFVLSRYITVCRPPRAPLSYMRVPLPGANSSTPWLFFERLYIVWIIEWSGTVPFEHILSLCALKRQWRTASSAACLTTLTEHVVTTFRAVSIERPRPPQNCKIIKWEAPKYNTNQTSLHSIAP